MDERGEDLARRAREGDRVAFQDLVEHYRDRAYRVAYRTVGNRDDALDAVQDAFIRLYRKLQHWDGRSRFFTWFYRMIVHVGIDTLRKRPRTLPLVDGAADFLADGSRPGQSLYEDWDERHTLGERAKAAVARLPEAQQAVVVLRHYEGLSLAEIADVRGVALGTIKSTLFAALRNLRRDLGIEDTNAQEKIR